MLGKGQQQYRDPEHIISTVNASAHLAFSFPHFNSAWTPQPIGPISRDLGQMFLLQLNLCVSVVKAMPRVCLLVITKPTMLTTATNNHKQERVALLVDFSPFSTGSIALCLLRGSKASGLMASRKGCGKGTGNKIRPLRTHSL